MSDKYLLGIDAWLSKPGNEVRFVRTALGIKGRAFGWGPGQVAETLPYLDVEQALGDLDDALIGVATAEAMMGPVEDSWFERLGDPKRKARDVGSRLQVRK